MAHLSTWYLAFDEMNNEQRKALDKEIRKERFRGKRTWILITLGVCLVLAVYTPVFSRNVYGESVSALAKERGNTTKFELKVRLDSGDIVTLLVDADRVHAAGERVQLSRLRSLAGISTYQFVRYVE